MEAAVVVEGRANVETVMGQNSQDLRVLDLFWMVILYPRVTSGVAS